MPPGSDRRFSDADARRRSVLTLQTSARRTGGLYLGIGDKGTAWTAPEQCTMVLGPARSGKTSSLIIPNLLAAPGPVVATSTKPELLARTSESRGSVGWTMLFDPSGTVDQVPGVVRIGWSPIASCDTWDRALDMSRAMVRTAHLTTAGGTTSPVGDHWSERAGALLAPLLHAAAVGDRPMSTLLSWVDRHEGFAALDLLAHVVGEEHPSANVLAGILATDPREQSGIWSTTSGVLSAYRSPAALESTTGPLLDAEAFCAGPNTLYICAAGRHQMLLAPLVVGCLTAIRDAAYERSAEGAPGPPVLLALDEAANIAPIPDLPSMITEGAGQGLITLACFQDLSQARSRWGRSADAFLSIFGTSVVLPGIADVTTLEAVSLLAGEGEVPSRTVGRVMGRAGMPQPSVSVGTIFRRRLPVDVIARGLPGRALCIDARNQMGWVALTPAHDWEPFRRHLIPTRQRASMQLDGAAQSGAALPETWEPETWEPATWEPATRSPGAQRQSASERRSIGR